MSDKPKEIVIPTPAGKAKFPRLGEPDTKFDSAGVYRVTLILRKKDKGVQDFLDKIEAAHEEAVNEAKANLKKGKQLKIVDSPIKPHLDENGDEVDGYVEISAKAKASGERSDGSTWEWKPPVVDAKKKPCKANVGGGSLLKLMVELSPFYTPALGAGVSLKLKAVQVLELVEFGGNAAAGFDEEEGYEAGESIDADEDEDEKAEDDDESGDEAEEGDDTEEQEAEEAPKSKAKKSAKPAAKAKGKKRDF